MSLNFQVSAASLALPANGTPGTTVLADIDCNGDSINRIMAWSDGGVANVFFRLLRQGSQLVPVSGWLLAPASSGGILDSYLSIEVQGPPYGLQVEAYTSDTAPHKLVVNVQTGFMAPYGIALDTALREGVDVRQSSKPEIYGK